MGSGPGRPWCSCFVPCVLGNWSLMFSQVSPYTNINTNRNLIIWKTKIYFDVDFTLFWPSRQGSPLPIVSFHSNKEPICTKVQLRITRQLCPKKKRKKEISYSYLSKAEGNLFRLLGFGAHQTKFFSKLCLPHIEINLAIVKDHSISCRPNDPACNNEDLSKKWVAKGCSSFNNHV
jgi:hypothetical protein